MDLNTYQARAWNNSTRPLNNPDRANVEYGALGLCAEAGELANLVKKHWRNLGRVGLPMTEEQKREVALEAGDVLWYLAFVCSVLGLTLDEVAHANIDKLGLRAQDAKRTVYGE